MANTKTLSPSCKLCRREGEKLFLKGDRCNTAKCAIVRRKFPPGQHGVLMQPRLTEYGQQLRAKQKAKRIYGIMERQFMRYYEQAVANKLEDSETGLKRALEMRFDNVVYRLGFAVSRSQARQMIGHGQFAINGKKVDIASYRVKVGDVLSVRDTAKNHPVLKGFVERAKQHTLPSWLSVDAEAMSGKVLSLPNAEDLRDTIEAKQIIEFYSRF